MCHYVHISALSPNLDKAIRVIDRCDHDSIISEQGKEEILLVLRASSTDIDSVIATAGSGGGYVDVETIAQDERYAFPVKCRMFSCRC